MADLSGDLGSFGLERVLELLADAGKDGELRVHSALQDGRILLKGGQVAYATTASGSDTVEELDALLERYQSDVQPGDLTTLEEVLEEQLIEVAYLLTQIESGSFEFFGSAGPSPDDVHSVPVAELLDMVNTRAEEWRAIRRVIPTINEQYRVAPQLPSDRGEVTLNPAQWAMLAATGAGASVAAVAAVLNLYEFHTAGAFSDLVGDGLIEPVGRPDYQFEAEEPSVLETEAPDELAMPHLQPAEEAVTFSTNDLSSDEMNEVIRNIGRGIFPS
ncbi:MAG: DUF4388 domain-containing protein [Acidimicrobiia bacterium]|nr:MAG: DUF4388 domain-containing protein [Acidimicrobiia bacterium]